MNENQQNRGRSPEIEAAVAKIKKMSEDTILSQPIPFESVPKEEYGAVSDAYKQSFKQSEAAAAEKISPFITLSEEEQELLKKAAVTQGSQTTQEVPELVSNLGSTEDVGYGTTNEPMVFSQEEIKRAKDDLNKTPSIPSFELPKLEIDKIEAPSIEMPDMQIPEIIVPKIEIPATASTTTDPQALREEIFSKLNYEATYPGEKFQEKTPIVTTTLGTVEKKVSEEKPRYRFNNDEQNWKHVSGEDVLSKKPETPSTPTSEKPQEEIVTQEQKKEGSAAETDAAVEHIDLSGFAENLPEKEKLFFNKLSPEVKKIYMEAPVWERKVFRWNEELRDIPYDSKRIFMGRVERLQAHASTLIEDAGLKKESQSFFSKVWSGFTRLLKTGKEKTVQGVVRTAQFAVDNKKTTAAAVATMAGAAFVAGTSFSHKEAPQAPETPKNSPQKESVATAQSSKERAEEELRKHNLTTDKKPAAQATQTKPQQPTIEPKTKTEGFSQGQQEEPKTVTTGFSQENQKVVTAQETATPVEESATEIKESPSVSQEQAKQEAHFRVNDRLGFLSEQRHISRQGAIENTNATAVEKWAFARDGMAIEPAETNSFAWQNVISRGDRREYLMGMYRYLTELKQRTGLTPESGETFLAFVERAETEAVLHKK